MLLYKGAENLRVHLEGLLLFSVVHELGSHWSVGLGNDGLVRTMALAAQLRSVFLVIVLLLLPGLRVTLFYFFEDLLAAFTEVSGPGGAFLVRRRSVRFHINSRAHSSMGKLD